MESSTPHPVGLSGILPPKPEKIDWLNLPCPIPFQEILREALLSLNPELFDGFLFGLTKPLNSRFSLSHRVFMGPILFPDILKVPSTRYEFGANFLDPKLTREPHASQGMFNFDYKGKDYRCQFQIGNNAFYGANYIQSVSPNLSLGSEIFWLGHQLKSGICFVARYNTDKMVATAQVASIGVLAMSYVQKLSEKVSLAADFTYNHMMRDVTSKFFFFFF